MRSGGHEERQELSSGYEADLAVERTYVAGLHRRLDDVRGHVVRRLEEALGSRAHNPQAVGEREAAVQLHTERLVALDAADSGLCFGRLDRRDTTVPRYVGRIGLSAEDGDEEPLLVDWRAPAAQPFYTATPLHDLGVRRRRHIRTRGRTVVSITDETLDLDDPAVAERPGLAGESVLLAALNATRTGRMTDIVRTIQAEQDRIIRADARGVLVVQGGPGTGKTAVALHRAAYLLYTHRERLARSGLLVVGPSPTFLRYIADVLPSLGETGVVLTDLGGLRPGLEARAEERPDVAEVKGRLAMADVIAAALAARQAVLDAPVQVVIDGTPLRFTKADAARVRSRARSASRLHNEARPAAARTVMAVLARKYADTLGANVLGGANLLEQNDVDALRREVASEPAVHALIDRLWPRLTAERLVRELLSSRERLTAATPGWSDADRELLLRPATAPWTPADVPLLEEADELLGVDDSAARAKARRDQQRRRRQAQETLDMLHGSRSQEHEYRGERRAAQRRRPARRRGAGRAAGGGRHPHHRRARRGRPHLDLRARDRRRGAGALGDGLARPDAPVPDPLDDGGRRRRPDRLPRRGGQLGGDAEPAPGSAAVAAGGADGQLPDAGRDHGRRGRGGHRLHEGPGRAVDRRPPLGAPGGRRPAGRRRRGRGRVWTRRTGRSPSSCRRAGSRPSGRRCTPGCPARPTT